MERKTKVQAAQGHMLKVHISPELVFHRALTLSGCRDDINLDRVLSHPVGPVPTSLFYDDGTVRKCTKAGLGHKLEEKATKYSKLPPFNKTETVYIRDAIAVIQMMDASKYRMLDDLASGYIKFLLIHF
jgi:hypothetical protein